MKTFVLPVKTLVRPALLLCAGIMSCGGPAEEEPPAAELARPIVSTNGQTQNGQTQNGTTYALAGADLRTARKLVTAPAPGTNPDLSAPTTPIAGAYLDRTLLRAPGRTGSFFENVLVDARMSDGTRAVLFINPSYSPRGMM